MNGAAPFAQLLQLEMTRQSLTLQDVADAVRRASGRRSRVSRHLVSRWRSGSVTPTAVHVRWLVQAFDVDLALWARAAAEQRPTPPTSSVPIPLQLLPPTSANLDYVQVLRESTQQLVRMDNLLGADDVAALARRLLRSARRQLREGRYDAAAEAPLAGAVAELAELTGWLLFDSAQLDEAKRTSHEAALLSRRAGDLGMEVLVMTNLALQAQYEHQPEEAIRVVRDLQVLAERESPRVRSVVCMREGRVHSQLGDRIGTVRAFDCARELFLEGPGGAPAWAWWIDQAELDFHAGMAFAELGEVAGAVELIQRAVSSVSTNRVRDQVMYQAQLLGVLGRARAWDDAEDVVEELTASTTEVSSARATTLLRESVGSLLHGGAPTGLAAAARELAERTHGLGGEELLQRGRVLS